MSQEATRRALTAMGIFVALVAIVVVYLVIVEQDDRAALSGVTTAGPCRSTYALARAEGDSPNKATKAATRNPECQQQSRLLFETCVTQELHPACALADQALKQQRRDIAKGATGRSAGSDNATGGGASSSPPASSQPSPSPPSGGPPVTPPGNPPTQPPTNPPTNPPDNQGPVGDLLDDVCTITTPLGICLN